jgi:hypothetical protein
MAEFSELVQALTWLVTNRIQQKIQYTHGLLGDGNGRVRVSTIPGSPEVDYVFVRPDRFSNRTFKVFNKRIEGQDGDPIIIGELPWEPGLIQVVDMDWAAYADVGWGDDVSTTNRHGISHQWRDGAPGIDTFNVYRRQFGDLKTYSTISGTLAVGVSPYSLDIFGKQYQWPGTQDFSLAGALPTVTGTARMALVYWSPASGTTQGFLGVATGTLGSGAEATILNRPVSPQGVIPSAFVRLAGGQSSITEFDIWDARDPFRPGLSFGTGTAGLSADMIPISDVTGFYTGSTVEAALMETPYKLIASDGSINPVLSADTVGDVTLAGTGTFAIPLHLEHVGDPDTRWTFTDDDIEATVGGLSMLKLTETGQDLITLGPGSGNVDIDFNGDMFLRGSDGAFAIGSTAPNFILQGVSVSANFYVERGISAGRRTAVFSGVGSRVPENVFLRARTGPSAVVNGDTVGDFFYNGHDGTDYNRSGRISILVDGTVSANTVPMAITFQTSETNSLGLTERMRIAANGGISIGNVATPLAQLHIDQESGSGAIPVMILDQADVDEPFTKYIGTAAAATLTRSIVAEGDVTTATRQGFVKIEIEDVGNQVTDQDYYVPFYTLS